MYRRLFGIVLLAVWSLLLFATGWAAASRRIVDRVESPDGRSVAFVRSKATLDPPSQTLWIASEGGPAVRVAQLAEDQDWCDQILWRSDGSQAGFLIRGSRLMVFDAQRKTLLTTVTLVEPIGYPGEREARWARFTEDGAGVRFRECARGRDLCYGEKEVALPR